MGWYIAAVTAEGSDAPDGYCIVDSVTGGIVRPMVAHPQSIFSEEVIRRIAAHLEQTHGDPRRGEHSIDKDTLALISTGAGS